MALAEFLESACPHRNRSCPARRRGRILLQFFPPEVQLRPEKEGRRIEGNDVFRGRVVEAHFHAAHDSQVVFDAPSSWVLMPKTGAGQATLKVK